MRGRCSGRADTVHAAWELLLDFSRYGGARETDPDGYSANLLACR
ncbi:hypothetical protein CSB95_6137 [Pseudomonas aeruginosa]|nr:hypothetical protein CSC29_6843 [Pseudomonas aeruginosa]PRW20154.1 hypothetical protein CSB95_6137 [Pseudomonas aeruginosa]